MIIFRNLLIIPALPNVLAAPSASGRALGDTLGQKRYELSNHLGNVLAVISDKRIVKGCRQYEAELHQATDYYPFGSPMPGRSITLGNNPAAPSHRKNPDDTPRTDVDEYFKQGKYYAIDGKKTLYLYYRRPDTPPGPFDVSFYGFRCTTRLTPLTIVSFSYSGPPGTASVQAFAAIINRDPYKATAVVGEQIIGGVMYDVIAVTLGAGFSGVSYGDVDFVLFPGGPSAPPLHIFVNPGTGDDDYRYGFNGKENDTETNSLDFDNRCYDPRVGRWLSVDPIHHPYQSPYTGFENNPIYHTDPNGTTVGDYYSKNTGKHLGSDGINDNKIYVVSRQDGGAPDAQLAGPTSHKGFMEKLTNSQNSVRSPGSQLNVEHVLTWKETGNVLKGQAPVTWDVDVNRDLHNNAYTLSNDNKCFNLSQIQLDKAGFIVPDYKNGDKIDLKSDYSNFFSLQSKIINSLSNGVPVIVGVDNNLVVKNSGQNGVDHFFVVLEAGKDGKRYYLSYYENANGEFSQHGRSAGNLQLNRLYLEDGFKMTGKSRYGPNIGPGDYSYYFNIQRAYFSPGKKKQ